MKKQVVCVALASVGLLVACGGGGGGGSAAPAMAPSAGGAAAKGIVKRGIVTANELDATGAVLRMVGTGMTDEIDGEFQITINSTYTGGPISFKLTADANTVMVCDVRPNCGTNTDNPTTVNFGSDMNVPGLSMEALVGEANSGDVLSINITPYTTMAATRARNAATLNSLAVNNANSAVSNLLGGLDVLSLKPVNLADSGATGLASPEQITYAAMSSAVGKLAIDSGTGAIDLDAALTKLGSSFETGSISAQTGTASAFSLQEIVDAANDQLGLQGLVDNTGVVTAIQQAITTAGSGSVTPTPSPDAGSTDIAKARALVQDIRTWGVTLDNLNGPANAFGDQVDMAEAVSEAMITSVSESLATAVDILAEHIDRDNGSFPYNGSEFGTTGTGTITVSGSDSIFTVNINGAIEGETINLTAAFDISSVSAGINALTFGLTGSVRTTDTSKPGVLLTLNTGSSVNASFSPAIVEDDITLDDTALDDAIETKTSALTFDIDASLAQINTPDPVTFTGTIGAAAVRVTSDSGEEMLVEFIPTQASLSGTVSSGSNSFAATINATITNADIYSPFQAEDESENNFLQGTLSMSITAALANQPEATLTVTARRTGFSAQNNFLGDVTAILALSGGGTTTVTVDQSDDDPANGTLLFENTSGASLSLTASDGDTEGMLMVGTTTVGSVSESGDLVRITYTDGTFETLN